jgi:hypothetical protein
MINTQGVIYAGDTVVSLNVDYTGEDYSAIEVPEADLVTYAEAVSIVA